jgi:hypothetical protein
VVRDALQPEQLRPGCRQRHRRRRHESLRHAQPHARLGLPPRVPRGHLERPGLQLRRADRGRAGPDHR